VSTRQVFDFDIIIICIPVLVTMSKNKMQLYKSASLMSGAGVVRVDVWN